MLGREENTRRWNKVRRTWQVVLEFFETLPHRNSDPFEVARTPEKLYAFFLKRQYSMNYISDILWVFNLYGEYLARQFPNRYFMKVRRPTGYVRDQLIKKNKRTTVSKQITPEQLEVAKKSLRPYHYKWIFISLWFGLRPAEVDGILEGGKHKILRVEQEGGSTITVLGVYQSKLIKLPEERRWKYIPAILPEQLTAIEYIKTKVFRRPLGTTLHRVFGDNTRAYAGRKSFANLLIQRGMDFSTISTFLGHTDAAYTYRHYTDPQQLQLDRIKRIDLRGVK
jgi:integrase